MKHPKTLVRIVLTVLVLGLLGWFIAKNWDDFSSLRIMHPWILLLSVPITILSLYSAGMVNEITMEPHGIKPSRKEVFALAAANRFLNQVATNYAGATMRAVYFKKKYGVSYTKFSSSFAVANVLQILISCLLAIGMFIVISGGVNKIGSIVTILVAGGVLVLALFLPTRTIERMIDYLRSKLNIKALGHLRNLVTEYGHVRSHPKMFQRMAFWMVSLTIISGVIIYLLYFSLGTNITVLEAIFIAGMTNLAIILSVTPAGLGIREGMIVFSASIIGVSPIVSLAVSILLRVVIALVSGAISLIFIRTLTRYN